MLTPAHRGHLAMLGFSALVAGAFSLGRLSAPYIAPSALTLARFGLSAALVGGVAAGLGQQNLTRLWQAPWRWLVLGGLMGLYFVLMFEGLKLSPAVSMSTVFTLTPILSAGFGWMMMRQVTTGRMGFALAMGGAGALWVIFNGDLAALVNLDVGKGEALFFIGCVGHAAYTPLVRLLNRGETPMLSSMGTMLGGFVVLAIYAWRDVLATPWFTLPAIVWIALIYLSAAATGLTFVALQYAALRLPAAKVMAYTYLVPVWVICWELALGHAAPPVLILPGVGLIVLALALLLKET